MKKILFITLTAIITVSLSACIKVTDVSTQNNDSQSMSESTSVNTANETLTDYANTMYDAIQDTELNSSARVDAIIMQAKKDAELVSSSIVADAATAIINNYPAYYGDDATMELYIYLGALIEYTNVNDDYAKLGQYTTEAIKYVYRGAESQTDEATLNKLAQVKELADKL